VPALINGDSAWLMLGTGLSRQGSTGDWARTVASFPVRHQPHQSKLPLRRRRGHDRIGELTLRNHRVALYPSTASAKASGRLQVGLVGHDVLQHYTVEIATGNGVCGCSTPRGTATRARAPRCDFTPDADLPLLRAHVKVRGRRAIPAGLLLDTGASGLCLIVTTPFTEQHGLNQVTPAIEAPIGTAWSASSTAPSSAAELRLAAVKVPSPTTGLGGESKGFLARTDIDGVVGNSVFEGSRLIVDYAGHRAIVEPRPGDTSPCDFDMSGLRLAARGPGLSTSWSITSSRRAERGGRDRRGR